MYNEECQKEQAEQRKEEIAKVMEADQQARLKAQKVHPLNPPNLRDTLTESQLAEVAKIKWWHSIRLAKNFVTDGLCEHGLGDDVFSRFGMSKNLTGKCVADVGGWDGLFSFRAEEQGAEEVQLFEPTVDDWGNPTEAYHNGFALAKYLRDSNVEKVYSSVYEAHLHRESYFDVVMCFGVMYHLIAPLLALKSLNFMLKVGGTLLLETAVHESKHTANLPAWMVEPGKADDPTNCMYPTKAGLRKSLKAFGFAQIEELAEFPGPRVTCRAVKTGPIMGIDTRRYRGMDEIRALREKRGEKL